MPVIFVSRTGTASNDIDADPAFGAVYEHRAERRRRALQRLGWFLIALFWAAIGAALFWFFRRYTRF